MSDLSLLTDRNPADGQLPEGWQQIALGEIVSLKSGFAYKSRDWQEAGVPVIKIANVRAGKVTIEGCSHIDESIAAETDEFAVNESDILMTLTGEIGAIGVYRESFESRLNQRVARIDLHATERTLLKYLIGFLESPEFRSEMWRLSKGMAQPNISPKQVVAIGMSLPPLAEQEKIVEILEEQVSRLDAALESVRVVREKAAQFRRSLLHAAFTGTLTGHNSADGQLPEGWEHVTLNDLVDSKSDIVDGPFGSNLKSSHYTEDGARVVRLQNIGFGSYLEADAFISLEHFDRLSKHNVVAGDLLFASLGENLPRACLAPDLNGPAIVKADCIRVRLSEFIDHQFVLHATQRPDARKWASDQLHGMGRPRLGLGAIRDFPVPLPPRCEQEQIVEILEEQLSRLDAALAVADVIEKRSAALRRSLLHAAFTGRLTEQWRESVHV